MKPSFKHPWRTQRRRGRLDVIIQAGNSTLEKLATAGFLRGEDTAKHEYRITDNVEVNVMPHNPLLRLLDQ